VTAAVEVIFGERRPVGRLPVTIMKGRFDFGHGLSL
jgi:hypothetical protein